MEWASPTRTAVNRMLVSTGAGLNPAWPSKSSSVVDSDLLLPPQVQTVPFASRAMVLFAALMAMKVALGIFRPVGDRESLSAVS